MVHFNVSISLQQESTVYLYMDAQWPNKQGFSKNGSVKLVKGGESYFSRLLTLIEQATQYIHLQTYIFNDDRTGTIVSDALKNASKRGVEVYIMVDGYASQRLGKQFVEELKSSGIHFRYFQPFFKGRNYYFGRRLHHKVFVADNHHALVGGINIADRYNDSPEEIAWLDFAVYIQGTVAAELAVYCQKAWNNFSSKPVAETLSVPDDKREGNAMTLARMRRNDWIRRKNEISNTYIELFRSAEKEITIVCSYFLPGKMIRRLLSNAARRGVIIKVVIAGPSDVMIAKHAERWLYDWLLRHRITLYEYQPTVLHAKMAICDHRLVTIGSYNINNISTYASIELNIDVLDNNFAVEIKEQVEQIISTDCKPVTIAKHLKAKHAGIQFLRWASYQFIRMVFYMMTLFIKQKRSQKKLVAATA